MLRKKSESNDLQVALESLKYLLDEDRSNVSQILHSMREHINERVQEHEGYSGAFDIGKYLAAQERAWKHGRNRGDWGGYQWGFVYDLLGGTGEYGTRLGRTHLYAYLGAYQACLRYVDTYPEIPALCNGVDPHALARYYRDLKNISHRGTGAEVVRWLKEHSSDLERRLVEQIRSRSDELVDYGIRLLSELPFDVKKLFNDAPLPDLWCEIEQNLVPIEVKDKECNYQVVGQVRCYLTKMHENRLADSKTMRCIVLARSFSKSVYYAAVGLPITFYKVDMERTPFVIDCIEADNMTKEEWFKICG